NTLTFHRTFREATVDAIGFSLRYSVPMGRYAVSARRTSVESTSTRYNDKCNWYGLKCRITGRRRYPEWTTISVQMRSGGRIAAQSENRVNLVATRILPKVNADGTIGAAQPTRNVADFV